MRYLQSITLLLILSIYPLIYTVGQNNKPEYYGGKSMLDTFLNLKIQLPDSIYEDYPLSFDLKISKEGKAFNPKTTNSYFQNQLEEVISQMSPWNVSDVAIDEDGFPMTINVTLTPQICSNVDEQAYFPSGTADMYRFITTNIKMPKTAQTKGFNQKVYVRFIVNQNGKIIKPTILRSAGEDCDAEALRILNIMPNWIPAKFSGKSVSSFFVMPITFRAQ